jgi:hypothetical protein
MTVIQEENWVEVDVKLTKVISNSCGQMIENKNEDLQQYSFWVYKKWAEIIDNIDTSDGFFVMKVAATLSASVSAAQQQADKFERSLNPFSLSKNKRKSAVLDAVAQGARQVFKENESKLLPFGGK